MDKANINGFHKQRKVMRQFDPKERSRNLARTMVTQDPEFQQLNHREVKEYARNIVSMAASILSKSTLQQELLRESVRTALVRMRDLERTTKNIVGMTNAKLKRRNTDDNKFFSHSMEHLETFAGI